MSYRVIKSEVIDRRGTLLLFAHSVEIICRETPYLHFYHGSGARELNVVPINYFKGGDTFVSTNLTTERSDNTGAKYTEAQKKASKKYFMQSREQLTLRLPKGCKERYKAHAAAKGKSLTVLIMELLETDMLK